MRQHKEDAEGVNDLLCGKGESAELDHSQDVVQHDAPLVPDGVLLANEGGVGEAGLWI